MRPVIIATPLGQVIVIDQETTAHELAERVSGAHQVGEVVFIVDEGCTLGELAIAPLREETALLKRLEASLTIYKQLPPDDPVTPLHEPSRPKQTKAQWRNSLRNHR